MTKAQVHAKTDSALHTLRHSPEKSFLKEGADADSIKICNLMNLNEGLSPLPEDYGYLLTQANGIMGPYFTLLGVGAMKTADGELIPSLRQETENINILSDKGGKPLALGRMSGGAMLIHSDGAYHLIDASTHDTLQSFSDIADFITAMIEMKEQARGRKI